MPRKVKTITWKDKNNSEQLTTMTIYIAPKPKVLRHSTKVIKIKKHSVTTQEQSKIF